MTMREKVGSGKVKGSGTKYGRGMEDFCGGGHFGSVFLRNSLKCHWDSTLRYQFFVDRTRESFNPSKCSSHDLTFVFES